MRIALFDPYLPKFTDDMLEQWQRYGHEVRSDRYYDPALVDWADVIWFETCDNNLQVATKGLPDHPDWPLSQRNMHGKKVVVRVIDIEAWYGHHLNVDWNYVDDVVFLTPHIKRLVEKDIDFIQTQTRVHVIPCGVNLARFPLSTKPQEGNKIAWVCEKWPTKGIDYALQIMAMLPRKYELHALGSWNDRYAWEKAYQEDFIEKNKIKLFDYEWVPNVAEFLADKDFLLSCSKKEAFGYSIAEGMAVGLKPIIHRFYGADDLWDHTWSTVDWAVDMILSGTDERQMYREQLIDKGYTIKVMMLRINDVIHA